jgi:signal transduction histidine kinase
MAANRTPASAAPRRDNPAMASAPPAAAPLPALRRALLALAVAGLVFGVICLGLVLDSNHEDDRGLVAVVDLVVGWSFVGTGLFAWWRRPLNRTGVLMTAVGFAWFAQTLSAANSEALFTIGIALDSLFPGIAGHLLLAFPSGRLESGAARRTVAGGYFVATVLQVPSLLFEADEPDDLHSFLVVHPNQPLSDRLDRLQYLGGVVFALASLVIVTRRWRAASPPQRRVLAPVLWTGGGALLAFLIAKGFDAAGSPQHGLEVFAEALLATVPFGFLIGLLRSRLAQATAMSDFIGRLGQAPTPDALREVLADALGDPSVALAYWLPESERFVDAQGRPVELPEGGWTEVELHGQRIAAIVHDASLTDEPQLVRAAGAAAALALDNQRLSAELRARVEELRASRARLVEAGDNERRRLERDLHDGAQSRLVALAMKLRLARRKADGQPEVAALLDESSADLQESLDELRELARGIHPAVLSDRGLGPALRSLVDRAPLPVELAGDPPEDLPPPVATAVYFVVAEALTNVAKYARAHEAVVRVERASGRVIVEVADDGIGGAQLDRGSGLRGLSDRVAALDGRLELDSPPGSGTRLRVELP